MAPSSRAVASIRHGHVIAHIYEVSDVLTILKEINSASPSQHPATAVPAARRPLLVPAHPQYDPADLVGSVASAHLQMLCCLSKLCGQDCRTMAFALASCRSLPPKLRTAVRRFDAVYAWLRHMMAAPSYVESLVAQVQEFAHQSSTENSEDAPSNTDG